MTHLTYVVLLNIVSANQNYSSELVESAVFIATQYYNHKHVTSVVWSEDDSAGVTYFLMKFNGPVVLTPLFLYDNTTILDMLEHYGYSQTVFFAAETEKFEQFMNIICKYIRFSIRLILVLKNSVTDVLKLATINGIAWENNLADIVVIYKNQSSNKIILSTYYPYSNGICGNYFPVSLEHSEDMFPSKFENFNKCPIRISARQHAPLVDLAVENGTVIGFGGYDASILRIIMNVLNATYEVFALESYGHVSSNGSTRGGFNDLVINKTDMIVPTGILNLERYSVTLTTQGYNNPRVCWIGPKRRPMYEWIKLMIPFFNNVTPFLCLAFTIFVLTAMLIKKRTLPNRCNGDSLCFRTFSLLVGQVVKFVTEVSLLNNIFLLWIWFCFILRIAYQGILVKYLRKTILEPQFGSLREAITEVDGFGGLVVFLDYYKDTPLQKDYIIMKRPLFYIYLNRTVNGERFLLVTDSYLFHPYRRSVQIMDEPVSSSLSCLYMRPGWPAGRAINSIVVRLLEAGITEKFLNLSEDLRENEMDNEAGTLNMSVVGSCFFLISFMWFICLVTFVIEIIYYKYTHTTRRR